MLWDEIIAKSERIGATTNQVFQEEVQKAVLASLSRDEAFNIILYFRAEQLSGYSMEIPVFQRTWILF